MDTTQTETGEWRAHLISEADKAAAWAHYMFCLSSKQVSLSRERGRLAAARTERERIARRVWVAQYEKEIERFRVFLGLPDQEPHDDLSLDELAAELADLK